MESAGKIIARSRLQENLTGRAKENLLEEFEAARKAGALGYMARALVQATLPHRKVEANHFQRRNGAFTLTLLAPPEIGLPYGNIPRLLMAWVSTEAITHRSRHLELGRSLSDFMAQLGLVPTGGRWGSITRLREQAVRLFGSFLSCSFHLPDQARSLRNIVIAEAYDEYFWRPKDPEQIRLFDSKLTLSQAMFDEIRTCPVRYDLRILRELRSPLAIDTYFWLNCRMSYLERETLILWENLELQFGSDYGDPRNFKYNFLKRLQQVLGRSPKFRIEAGNEGLILRP